MTHTSDQTIPAHAARSHRDLGAQAMLLGYIPFATWVFPRQRPTQPKHCPGLYPAADAATALAIRAGVRAGHR